MRCVATDMDGTLLNKKQIVSDENRRALEKVAENGGQVIVATGRSYKEAQFALKDVNFNCPIISMNGAAVYDEEGTLISSNPIDREELKETVRYLEGTDTYFELYTNHGTYSKEPKKAIDTLVDIFLSANESLREEDVRSFAESRIKYGFVFATDDYQSLIMEKDIAIYKILVFSLNTGRLNEISSNLSEQQTLTVTSSGKGNIEITKHGIAKGTALTALLNQLGISIEETMAIGDNENDISMFKIAGLSVAMGNASEKIKDICMEVTYSNEENGVARSIEKNILPFLIKNFKKEENEV